jgi:hypothetical protein
LIQAGCAVNRDRGPAPLSICRQVCLFKALSGTMQPPRGEPGSSG